MNNISGVVVGLFFMVLGYLIITLNPGEMWVDIDARSAGWISIFIGVFIEAFSVKAIITKMDLKDTWLGEFF